MTQDEIDKCMSDPIYFATNWVPEATYNGHIQYRDKHQDQLQAIHDNKYTLIDKTSAKDDQTRIGLVYGAWLALSKPNESVLIMSPNQTMSQILHNDVVCLYDDLPRAMRPKFRSVMMNEMHLRNGSVLRFHAYDHSNAVRGLTINYAYLDEYAFGKSTTEFYETVMPIVASTESKIVITSTQKSPSHFNKLLEEDNSFIKIAG